MYHFLIGSKYREIPYAWRVSPHNNTSLVVREVCEAIDYEYAHEMLSPLDTEDQRNCLHVIGAYIRCKPYCL
ncbi:hypothetical protein DPMN_035307 [Dreissena polymorpha]|uniref:Uncharacterized protein n=1 Tax=Dreissena polymorpha TaxID=45954 RepID=A0A9D4MAB7_DREPO|nr:hypothetical protein DPMN_035307 [Dreissena polymorpha]